MPFQRFPSAERASEFPCVCDATGENTQKPDNAKNTRARPTFDSRAFSQLAASALRHVAFTRNPQICVYACTTVHNEYVTRRNSITKRVRKVWELDFSKISLAVAEFCKILILTYTGQSSRNWFVPVKVACGGIL